MPADALRLGWEGRITPQLTLDASALLVKRKNRVATLFARGTEDATAGYGMIDLGATWHLNKDHSLRLAVKNLADKHYHEHLAEGSPGIETPAPGRSIALSWHGQF